MSQIQSQPKTESAWAAAAAKLSRELQQQPAVVQQAMQQLSKREYRN